MAFQISKSHKKTSKRTKHKQQKKQARKVLTRKFIIRSGIIVFLVLFGIGAYTYFYYSQYIATPERLMNHNNSGVVMLDSEDKPFYTAYDAKTVEVIDADKIPDITKAALVSSEDKDFYEHSGYSIKSIIGALAANVLKRDSTAYGGSTITQQLVKNSLLTTKKSYLRKFQEIILSVSVDRKYSKDETLTMYMNSVFFGEKSYGIEAAAQTYFGVSADKLDLAQSSMLVGILPAPSAYSPITGDMEKAKQRQSYVLKRMVADGKITEEEATAAKRQELAFKQPDPTLATQKAPHFAEMVLTELRKTYDENELARSGFTVKTTLNSGWQSTAEQAARDHIRTLAYANASNSGVVAIEPGTGKIRVAVGSVDYNNQEFGKVNMVTAKRQTGSSFKPIYYSKALEDGVISPATILHDVPTTFGTSYKPLNYDKRFRGNISVRRALTNSLNIPAVEVMEKYGVNKSIAGARDLGITTLREDQNYGLSLALGTAEVPLLEMTNAYATFANQGTRNETTTIESITNKYDQLEYQYKSNTSEGISPQGAFLVSSILSDNQARSELFGKSMNIDRVAAVKTGTTENRKDSWAIGYTPQLAVGVWVGNNDNESMNNIAGSSGAGPIWKKTIQSFLSGQPKQQFNQPSGVEKVLVCFGTELRASVAGSNVISDYFLSSKVPTGNCNVAPKEEPKVEPKPEPEVTKEEPVKEENPIIEPPKDNEIVVPTPPVTKPPVNPNPKP
jgi:1A family penicillin-binding protein